MKFGNKKCMITTFFKDMTELKKLTFMLEGEVVLIRDNYKYLGIQIDPLIVLS